MTAMQKLMRTYLVARANGWDWLSNLAANKMQQLIEEKRIAADIVEIHSPFSR